MTLTAAAELGLTVFLLTAGSEMRTWAGPKYSSLYVYLDSNISLLTAAS